MKEVSILLVDLAAKLKIHVNVVEQPLQNIILGAGAISENEVYHSLISA